ncbi:hypothetical protein DL93DRAFT_451801 [Clavulina sp. PMI_390]|nr:hypothetical protein DL93DRAFT_451801 [Clavulina sp. PMI_390]
MKIDQMNPRDILRAIIREDGDLSDLQLQQIRAILTTPRTEKIVTIFSDVDQFRSLLVPTLPGSNSYDAPNPAPELYENLTMQTVPPRGAFTAVLEAFRRGKLNVAPITRLSASVAPPVARAGSFGTLEARWRLFTDVTRPDILPTGRERFKPQETHYNNHETAWKLFQVIVRGYGDILDSSHSNIDWINVSARMGRPYETDRRFTAHLYVTYFDYVAPIVGLWLWEVNLVMRRQIVASRFSQKWDVDLSKPTEPVPSTTSPVPSIPQPSSGSTIPIMLQSSHKLEPTNLVMEAVHESFTWLNNELYCILTPEQLDALALVLAKPLSYVKTIAMDQNLRAVIRHLPKQPLELVCNVTQWVLDKYQKFFAERPNIIKLLQDLSYGLPVGKLPQNLECIVEYNIQHWRKGGEADLKRHNIRGQSFVICVPIYSDRTQRDQVYLTDKANHLFFNLLIYLCIFLKLLHSGSKGQSLCKGNSTILVLSRSMVSHMQRVCHLL